MKQKITMVDLLAEKGHILFVKRLIEILQEDYDVQIISSNSYCKELNANNFIGISDKLFLKTNKYSYVLRQLKIIKMATKNIEPNSIILVTSFENISFSIGWNIKSFAFIHNNLDKKGISLFFFKKVKKKIKFCVFEKYISDYLQKQYQQSRIKVIPHPINFKKIEISQNSEENSSYVFAVNVDTTTEEFCEFSEYFAKQSIKIFVKSKKKFIDNKFLTIKKYYENYEEMISNSLFVVLDINYNYRVSGVFYECMYLNKKIFFINSNGMFSTVMKNKYSENCLKNYRNVDINKTNNKKFLDLHNDKKLLSIFKNEIKL